MKPRLIVHGHGVVAAGTATVPHLADAATALQSEVAEGVRKGEPLAAIRKTLDMQELEEQRAGTHADRRASFEIDSLLPGVTRAYREAMYNAAH